MQVNVDDSVVLQSRSVLVIKWDPDKWPKKLRSFTTQAHSKTKRGVLAIVSPSLFVLPLVDLFSDLHKSGDELNLFEELGVCKDLKWNYDK